MIAAHHIVRGWLESPTLGVIELDRDWTGTIGPRFTMGQQCPRVGLVFSEQIGFPAALWRPAAENHDLRIVHCIDALYCSKVTHSIR